MPRLIGINNDNNNNNKACGCVKTRYYMHLATSETGKSQHFRPHEPYAQETWRFSPAFVVIDVAMVRVVRTVRYPPAVVRYEDKRVRQVAWSRQKGVITARERANKGGARQESICKCGAKPRGATEALEQANICAHARPPANASGITQHENIQLQRNRNSPPLDYRKDGPTLFPT